MRQIINLQPENLFFQGQVYAKRLILCSLILAVSLLLCTMVFAEEIHEAAKSGDVRKVVELIEKDPNIMYVKDEEGKTALHWATGRGQLEVIKVLIRYKVNINVKNDMGGTPLHVAASQAQPEALKILLANGANVHARGDSGATPLHFAAFKRRPGHLEAARILLENKADVNAVMENGATPLDMALSAQNIEMVNLLRQYGAKQRIYNKEKPMRIRSWDKRDDYK